jgi:hypothetical protein
MYAASVVRNNMAAMPAGLLPLAPLSSSAMST